MESGFIRFKNNLRAIKENETKFFQKVQPLYETAQKILKPPRGYLNSIANHVYWQNFAREKGYKNADLFKEVLRKETEAAIQELDICQKRIAECNEMLSAIANDQATGYIEDFAFFLNILLFSLDKGDLNINEATAILGSVIYANNKLAKKTSAKWKKELFKDLATHFDAYGNFQKSGSPAQFFNQLTSILLEYPDYLAFEAEESLKLNSVSFFTEVSDLYSIFLDALSIEKEPVPVAPVVSSKSNYSSALKEYYHNGKLVKIPEDITAFSQLLAQNAVPENEQRHIFAFIEEAIEEEKKAKLAGFYENDDQNIIVLGNNFINEAKNYQESYYEIRELLWNIQSLEDMYIDATNPEDKSFVLEEKEAFMTRLKELVIPKVEVEPLNIAFLSDADGIPYFAKDLESIDKGIRKRTESLLARINNANKRSFRKVYTKDVSDFDVYEVNNPNMHIIFIEIPGNVYMIIGIATSGRGYREIPNRLANKENRENIALIIETIKDATAKKKYLAEQNNKISELSLSRTRKQIDN